MNSLAKILLICLLGTTSVATARMYQWTDPDTGTTQLSGKPPHWYRGSEQGPRVFVIENGKVIDDTSIEVSREEREFLRQDALIKAEHDRAAAREKLLQARQLEASLGAKEEGGIVPQEIIVDDIDEDDFAEMDTDKSAQEKLSKEDMQEMIQLWEQKKAAEARKLLQSAGQ